MGASESTYVGGSLLAVCLLVSGAAHAVEPAQSRASTSSLPGLSLPAFLDDNRVPDLQEAWQAHVREAQESHRSDDKAPAAPAAKDASVSGARAATQRAGQDGGEAADVRQRAEELSRRFGAAGAVSEPVGSIERPNAEAAPAAAITGTPAAAHGKEVVVAPLDAGALEGAVDAKAAALRPSARPQLQDVDMSQKLRLAAPPPARDIPPNPVRAPRATASITAPPSKVGGPVVRSVPARKGSHKVDVTGDILPTELRAFGWDTQPD